MIETHVLIGPKALDKRLYHFAIERAAAVVDQGRSVATERPGYTRCHLYPQVGLYLP